MRLMAGVTRCLILYVMVLLLPAIVASQPPPPPPMPSPFQLAPGWYRNSGPAVICENCTGLTVQLVWENSYIYQYPGTDPLYWYAQLKYVNTGNQTVHLSCAGRPDPSLAKEHMRGTANAGYVAAEETLCSRNPNLAFSIEPGGTYDGWAIFHNVPWPGGEVALEWGQYGLSAWVDPWHTPFSAPPPAECPPELVTIGTCQEDQPTSAPSITLLGADPLQHTAGCPFVGAGATATDTEDGDLTDSIIITGTENLNNPGLHTITYSVTDSDGLSDSETRQVVVSGVIGTPGCFVGSPAGKAPYLIVLVHGCCTDANGVKEWDDLGRIIAEAIQNPAPEQWEIVVWDWHTDTPKRDFDPRDAVRDYRDAYENSLDQGHDLKIAIAKHPYKYVHLIAHSAGSNLIDVAAKGLILEYQQIQNVEERPFIHLTFLDAFTPGDLDKDVYGHLANYPHHYSEHYVDRTEPLSCPGVIERVLECVRTAPLFSVACAALFATIEEARCAITALFTNEFLTSAFNFDITSWQPVTSEDKEEYGHQWPRRWYQNSVTFTSNADTTPKPGFKLSFEGGNNQFDKLAEDFFPGKQCSLTDVQSKCR